jgi:hypothetical protein
MVKDIIPDIIEPVINSISKEIKLKNEKIKGNILQLLSTLGLVAPNETVLFLGNLIGDLQVSLKENNVHFIYYLELCHYNICLFDKTPKESEKHSLY